MKKLITYVLAFIMGVVLGGLVVQTMAKREARLASDATILRWKQSVPRMTAAYYHPARPVPLPRNLDLSTNTWPQLSFWCGFARSYQLLTIDDLNAKPRLIALGFPFADPFWIQTAGPGFAGAEFAKLALRKSEGGMRHEELVDWVAKNYPSNAVEDRSEFWLNMATNLK